jgi:hypothetical protein
MRSIPWAACLVALWACGGEDDPGTIPFPLTGAQFQLDFDLAYGPDQCTADGTVQFTQSGAQLTGTLTAARHCNGEDTDLSGPVTAATLDGTHFSFTVETEPAECTFTGDESRDGTNEELRGTVECRYGEEPWTGLFVAFRTSGS